MLVFNALERAVIDPKRTCGPKVEIIEMMPMQERTGTLESA